MPKELIRKGLLGILALQQLWSSVQPWVLNNMFAKSSCCIYLCVLERETERDFEEKGSF